jgi:TFIIF-interacting CTD phosphatase-like protein
MLDQEELEKLKKQYDWQIGELGFGRNRMIVKFRPLLKELFESIKDKYLIYIYTYGTKEYAEAIIKYINKAFDYEYLSLERMVARENNNIDYKSIKRIFPTMEDMVVILDDRTDVWKNSKNLINLVPYFFFADEKVFNIKDKYVQNECDMVLYSVHKMLLYINSAFYYYFEKHKERFDVKKILGEKLQSIFYGKNFIFSGLYPRKTDIFNTRQAYIIDIFGGSLLEDYSPDLDYVVTNTYQSKQIY